MVQRLIALVVAAASVVAATFLALTASATTASFPHESPPEPADGTPMWSFDGTRIVFVTVRRHVGRPTAPYELDAPFALHSVSPAGRDEARLRELPAGGELSPDRTRIAALVFRGGRFHLDVINLSDGTRRTFATFEFSPRALEWSPDGTRLLYAEQSGSDITIVDLASGSAHTIQAGVALKWSPDASQIAYLTRAGALELVRPDGTGRRLLAAGPFFPPSWSPDGRAIAVARTDRPGLVIIDAASGARRHLPVPYRISVVLWSPDGQTLAFTGPARLRGNYFATGPGAKWFVIGANGRSMRAVPGGPWPDAWAPAWSPDGSWITFASSDVCNRAGVHVVNVRRAEHRRLTNQCRIAGTSGRDMLSGTVLRDAIYGRGGADRIDAGGGDDLVEAGAGNDVVEGFQGYDEISGGPGADRLYGELLNGGPGRDVLVGRGELRFHIWARDGERDAVSCDEPLDPDDRGVVLADRIDRVTGACRVFRA